MSLPASTSTPAPRAEAMRPPPIEEPTRGWPEDVLVVAAEWGVTPSEAASALAWENALGIAAAQLEDVYPSTFAGIEILEPLTRSANVAFVGPAPVGTAAIRRAWARAVGGDESMVASSAVEEAARSRADSDQRVVEVHYAVVAQV